MGVAGALRRRYSAGSGRALYGEGTMHGGIRWWTIRPGPVPYKRNARRYGR